MLRFADQKLMNDADAYIYDEPKQEIAEVTSKTKTKIEDEIIPILLAMLHRYETELNTTPIYARSTKLIALRNELQAWIGKGYDFLGNELIARGSLASHLEELRTFYGRIYPGRVFNTPDPVNYPEMLLGGMTNQEWLIKLRDGFGQRIIKHYQNGETIFTAVTKGFESGEDILNRFAHSFLQYRNRIAEALFYKANPDVFRYVVFTAMMDSRTSKICRGLHGLVFNINNPSLPVPPLHPRCRSRLVPLT